MLQRWSNRMIDVLRANLRRGALFTLAGITAIALTVTPLMSQPVQAEIPSVFGGASALGGSFTNGLSSCAIETVGWVICPLMRSIAKLADYGFTYINQNFLKIDYNIAANDSGIYKAWEIMRNVANGLFVVAFMILIYSQLTGKSAGGYNIKRLLPRLIICAILVNSSYYLCVGLIDISNILGDSLTNILQGIADRVGTSVMPLNKESPGTLSAITSSVMTNPSTAWVLLAPVAAVIISIATITAAALILLIMRKTVIAMLVLVSPLLFVAYLLPNLERFFFQGVRLFIQLLMLYPIIALLLGAGQIVSATIVTVGSGGDANYHVSGDNYSSKNGGSGSAITDSTAAAAAVVPLLGVWFIFKNMSSIMSTAGSRLSATVGGRRGDKDDKDARVTGKASVGAANNKSTAGLSNPLGRRQAFSRNKRRKSLSGSSLTGEEEGGSAARAGLANRQQGAAAAMQNALEAAGDNPNRPNNAEDAAKKFEELQNAQIEGSGNDLNLEGAAANALAAGAQGDEKDKQKTAKDYLENINKDHQSKDKERKLSSGPPPAGNGGGQQTSGGESGSAAPSAPTVSYKAPSMAQGNNIVSGGSAPTQVKVVAVPVQIDGSALLGQNNQHRPPENVSQPPISGTEEKAKARAQKYLFDADQDIKDAADKADILGHDDTPTEAPHTNTIDPDKENGDRKG
ncbi:MAG: rane protein of unknown function [Candidatus Saccharibacteria bacterium]|nr:rane protein of unknown function [Candidatus Saccharibacteria bacterium]